MMHFLNKLKFSDQKYQTNGNVRYENYKGKLFFTIKYFVLFVTDPRSMSFMSTNLLKDKVDGAHVIQLQLAYSCSTTHPSHKLLVKLCCEVYYMS